MASSFAPGRLELIGNHTDYNEGYVMSFAVNLGVTMEGEPREDGKVSLKSEGFGEETFSLENINKDPHNSWSNYSKGVLLQLQQNGAALRGFDARITSTIPAGAGMSSSAAITVATLLFAQKVGGFELGDLNDLSVRFSLAMMCRAAENSFVGVKCGILDPASSLLGKKDYAIFLDCRSNQIELIPLQPSVCFVVCHTGAKHMLLSSKYNARHSECEEAVKMFQINKIPAQSLRDVTSQDVRNNAGIFRPHVFQRAMHVTTENERVLSARTALLQGDIESFGKLMFESHASSKEAFENSTLHLDQLVEIARELPGCLGARLTGGGFGGATLSMVYREEAGKFMAELVRLYREKSGKEPQAWIVEAAEGAG